MDELEGELGAMIGEVGWPDLLLVTGDLADTGREYDHVDQAIDRVRGILRAIDGSAGQPLLFAVPGNHDVVRPAGRDRRAYRVLRSYGDGDDEDARDLREELWADRDARLIEPLFQPYVAWSARSIDERACR